MSGGMSAIGPKRTSLVASASDDRTVCDVTTSTRAGAFFSARCSGNSVRRHLKAGERKLLCGQANSKRFCVRSTRIGFHSSPVRSANSSAISRVVRPSSSTKNGLTASARAAASRLFALPKFFVAQLHAALPGGL
jgi:hypothetical protein